MIIIYLNLIYIILEPFPIFIYNIYHKIKKIIFYLHIILYKFNNKKIKIFFCIFFYLHISYFNQ